MTNKPGVEDVGYFVEWGGRPWADLTRRALDGYLGGRLDGLRTLDIGARSGRMSSLLALRGAEVIGIDITPGFETGAKAEAQKWGVDAHTTFVVDDGRLGSIEAGSIDVVLTKSVLVMIGGLDSYLPNVARTLRPGGRFVFIENGRGSGAMQLARRLRHPTWDLSRHDYWDDDHIATVRRHLHVDQVIENDVPPIYLVCGRRLAA